MEGGGSRHSHNVEILASEPGPAPVFKHAGWFQGSVKVLDCDDEWPKELYKSAEEFGSRKARVSCRPRGRILILIFGVSNYSKDPRRTGPPSSKPQYLSDIQFVSNLMSDIDLLVILGDFNLPELSWSNT